MSANSNSIKEYIFIFLTFVLQKRGNLIYFFCNITKKVEGYAMARKYGFREFYSTFKTDFKVNNDMERLQEMLGEKIVSSITPSVASNLVNKGLRRKEANQICLSGVTYYTDHFNCMFGEGRIYFDKLPDKISDFQKKYSIPNAVIQEFDDDVFQNLAVLLISAATNDLFYLKYSEENTDVSTDTCIQTQNKSSEIFDFLKTQKLDDISNISIMFHSGFNWYLDHKSNGRGALLRSIQDNGISLRIIINDAIQTVFDTGYLSSNYGSYPAQKTVIEEWKKLAEKRAFSLKAFRCILFHSLCIIELKNNKKILYVSHYIYNHVSGEEHPKYILWDSHPYFESYYNEFNFIWENGDWLHNPDNPE